MSNQPLSDIALSIAKKRYFVRDEKGNIVEDWHGLVTRVVNHVCGNESEEYKQKIFDLIYSTKFLPNSPCLVNAGRKGSSGIFACFVSRSPGDSWEEMCRNIKTFGDVARRGGGNGISLSNIRPEGAPVFGSTHAKACGPIEHMRMISEVMSSITQSGFRGMACATGDTYISTNDGYIQIKDIVDDMMVGKNAYTQFGEAQITDAWYNGKKEVFEIITERGYSLKLTADHLVYVIDNYNGRNHGKLSKKINKIGKWKKVSDLDIKKDCLLINLDEKPFSSNYMYLDGVKLDEKMAALIAYLKCDGLVGDYKSGHATSLCLDSNESLDYFTTNNFNGVKYHTTPSSDKKNGIMFVQKGGKTTEFINKKRFGEFYTYQCSIPKEVFRSPKSVIAAFLRSSFDAEGGAYCDNLRCRIKTGMTSLEYIRGLQLLLSMFGIQCSVRKDIIHNNKDGRDRKPMHYLDISNKWHVRKFMDEIMFFGKRKNNAAENKISQMNYSGTGRGKVPSYKKIQRIKSIKSVGIKDVYDISTTNETFLANSITVHNCMATLNASHPDIEKFIKCKQRNAALKSFLKEDIFNHYDHLKENSNEQLNIVLDKFISNFNISVFASDEFMKAVINDENYNLVFSGKVYKTIKAREIFQQITLNAWKNGDPGLLFEDTINNCPYKFSKQKINATNPCGEQCLPDGSIDPDRYGPDGGGSCNLGSIAVNKFVTNSEIDWESLKLAVQLSCRFLDNAIDANKYPSIGFENWAKDNRPIGLGVMGWADLLLSLKISYGSEKSLLLAKELIHFMHTVAHETSVQLAKERGSPKCCDFKELDHRRNVTLLSIAPTGTISLLSGCSSSIEPVFSPTIYRYDNTGSYQISHPDSDKDYFKCALDKEQNGKREVSWKEHILMQAAFQKYVDSAVSKTINMPNSVTIEDVHSAYILAWQSGLKGITIYRDGCKTTQVLNTERKKNFSEEVAIRRPTNVACDIHKVTVNGKEWHIIVGKVNDCPYEIFAVNGKITLPEKGVIVKKKKRHYSLLDLNDNVLIENLNDEEELINDRLGLETRRLSLELRHGIHPRFIAQQIDKSNESLVSFSKAVSRIIKKHYLTDAECASISLSAPCPMCIQNGKDTELIFESGCQRCPVCAYSKCG